MRTLVFSISFALAACGGSTETNPGPGAGGGTTSSGPSTGGGGTSADGGAGGGGPTGGAAGTPIADAGSGSGGSPPSSDGATEGSIVDVGAPAEGGRPTQITDFPIPTLPGCAMPYPHDPAVSEDTGIVYYTDSNASCIGQFDPVSKQFKAWPTPTPNSYPHGLVVATNNRVFYTGQRVNRVGRLDPASGMIQDFPVAAQAPHTPVFHMGSIWFTAQTSGQYGRLNPDTGMAEIFDFSSPSTGPYGIWPAPDGALWVALFGTNKLARIAVGPTPTSEEFTLPNAASRPRRIAVDGKGRVYYTDYPRRKLGMMDPSLPMASRFQEWDTPGGGRPYGIAIGPDGRVWFDDEDAPEIVCFDQDTTMPIARLPVPIANSGPVRNMVVDRVRKRIWVSVSNVGHLGLIQF
jgi:virginiamycin B lyase